MGFFDNIKRGFAAASATRKLVFGDKQLFIYPVLAFLVEIIALVLFAGITLLGWFTTTVAGAGSSSAASVAWYVWLFLLYALLFFITTYFLVAMLIAFKAYERGKPLGVFEALNQANQYLVLIVEWALFYTVVATVLHIIESIIDRWLSRFGFGGAILSSIITGTASLALFIALSFSVPVIVDNRTGPIETVKKSVAFIRENFGEAFGGFFYTEVVYLVAIIVGFVLFALGVIAGGVLAGLFFVLGFSVIVLGAVLQYVLFSCFRMIIYDYKTTGFLPNGFDKKLIDDSIKTRQKPRNIL